MKAKIFYGQSGSGKTRTANIIRNFFGKENTIYLTGRNITPPSLRSILTEKVKTYPLQEINKFYLIIVDEVPEHFSYQMFLNDLPRPIKCQINEKFQNVIETTFSFYSVIFITEKKPEFFTEEESTNFDIIEFPNDDFGIFTRPTDNNIDEAAEYLNESPDVKTGFSLALDTLDKITQELRNKLHITP